MPPKVVQTETPDPSQVNPSVSQAIAQLNRQQQVVIQAQMMAQSQQLFQPLNFPIYTSGGMQFIGTTPQRPVPMAMMPRIPTESLLMSQMPRIPTEPLLMHQMPVLPTNVQQSLALGRENQRYIPPPPQDPPPPPPPQNPPPPPPPTE